MNACGCEDYHLADCPIRTARLEYPTEEMSGEGYGWDEPDV